MKVGRQILWNVTPICETSQIFCLIRRRPPFKGPIIPFGSLVEHHPITAKDQSRIHQFGKKVLPGLFLGYAEGIWKGDTLVADLDEWYGDQFKERVILTSLENEKGLFYNLMTHFRMPVKQLTIFGPCREASYTAITLNPESNFTRREKNLSLFH